MSQPPKWFEHMVANMQEAESERPPEERCICSVKGTEVTIEIEKCPVHSIQSVDDPETEWEPDGEPDL